MRLEEATNMIMQALAKWGDEQTERKVTRLDIEAWLSADFDRFIDPEPEPVDAGWVNNK